MLYDSSRQLHVVLLVGRMSFKLNWTLNANITVTIDKIVICNALLLNALYFRIGPFFPKSFHFCIPYTVAHNLTLTYKTKYTHTHTRTHVERTIESLKKINVSYTAVLRSQLAASVFKFSLNVIKHVTTFPTRDRLDLVDRKFNVFCILSLLLLLLIYDIYFNECGEGKKYFNGFVKNNHNRISFSIYALFFSV